MADNWFTQHAPKSGGWFAANAPSDSSRPAGLPAGVELPSLPKSPALPIGMTSDKPGDSPDWRVRLYGNDGSQMLKTPLRHVKDAALGLASNPLVTAKSVLYDQPMAAIEEQIKHPDVSKSLDAIPVIGPWARQVESDAKDYGAVPALLGLGTDAVAPEAMMKVGGAALRGAGMGTRLAGTSAESAKLAGTRLLVPGEAGEVLQRALKPSVKYGANVSETLEKTLPDAVSQGKIGGVSDYAAALDAAKDANAAEHGRIMAPYGGDTPRNLRINGNDVMRAQEESVPALAKFEGAAPNRLAVSPDSPYNRWIPAAEADELRKGANQELHSFYQKAEGDRYAALASPEASRVKAVGDSVRDQLYPAVESDQRLAPGSIAERQKQYGRLSEAADIAGKRDIVFGRHDPVSLPEKLAFEGGHGITAKIQNYALQKLARGLTDSDALVRSAVDRYQNPAGTPLTAGPIADAVSRSLTGSGNLLRRLSPFAPLAVRRYATETE